MDVCERCGFPAVQDAAGKWVHADQSGAAFCVIATEVLDALVGLLFLNNEVLDALVGLLFLNNLDVITDER